MQGEDEAWTEYREKFAELYDGCNYASPLQSFAMRASHRLVERPFGANAYFGMVLEVGAGTGEHLSFIRHGFGEYILSDVDSRALEVAKGKVDRKHKGSVSFDLQQADQLTYADNSFDRIVATHVLEHIYKPHVAIREWRRVLKHEGVLSILIPTDPGVAWRLGRYFGPRRNAVALGIAYDYVMAREHVNSCNNLIALLRHYFPDAKCAWWPSPIASIDLNLFFAFHGTLRKTEQA